MRAFFRNLFSLLEAVFGRLSWSPPDWLAALGRILMRPLTATAEVSRRFTGSRRALRVGARVLVGTMVLGVGCFLWSKAPKPAELSVRITTPAATPIRDGAVPEPVHIYFGGSAARLEQVDKVVESGIEMEPALAGVWTWRGDAQLTFTPENDWPIGETVRVNLLKGFAADHVKLETDELEFTTAKFNVSFSQTEFYQDPVDPAVKKVVATLRFSHPVDSQALEPRISMRMTDPAKPKVTHAFKVAVSYDKLLGEAYLHSETIPIPLKDAFVEIVVQAGVTAARGGEGYDERLTRQVRVPGRYNLFRIRNANITLVRNERYEPEQVLILTTTAGVLESELQKNLEVWILPKDRPKTVDQKAVKNYTFRDPAKIGPEVFAKASKIIPSPIPSEHEYAQQHTFKLDLPVGRQLFVRVKDGTEAYGGYILPEPYETILRVPKFPKELEIMHDGAILSVSGEKKLSVLSRGLPGMRMVLFRVMPSEINHLLSQSSGDFKSPAFQNYRFNESNISEVFRETYNVDNSDPGKTQYVSVDFSKYLEKEGSALNHGLFVLRAQGWNAKRKRRVGPEDRRLVLLTDLGVLVKTDVEQKHYVFVQSIRNGKPVAGASVSVLGKNGLPVLTRATDAAGLARFPKLSDFKYEKKPVAYLVRNGADISFLPMDRGDRVLNFSRFDVGGTRTAGRAGRLDAYLFSDRGIYRPGDEFHIGTIVKSVDWERPLKGIPIQLVVTDARGLEVHKRRINLNDAGFVELSYRTEESAPTGTYNIRAYIVKDGRRDTFLGATTVRVEEFLPDRMRIVARFNKLRADGWVSPEDLSARVELKNLFGTPAADRRISASISLRPRYPNFRGWYDWTFYDPMRAERSYEERLEDGTSDAEGLAEFDLDLSRFEKATYRLSFLAEGFENDGGRGVSAETSIMVSPLQYLVGYKADGSLSYIQKAAERYVKFAAVGPDLEKVEAEGLKLALIEQRWVSVLVQQPNGTYKYQSVLKDITRKVEDFKISEKGVKYRLPTKEPGQWMLVVKTKADVELNRVRWSVMGAANLTRDLERNAELEVRLDKPDYSVGSTIKININAPYTGAGLITIERDRVYAHKWFKADTTSSVQTITVPEGLEATGYVNVTFVRGLDSREIFMSPLSYGVVPFSVSRKKRTIEITLETPDVSKPGEVFEIKYKTDKPAKIAVFAVDEGILQVAAYKTPDPLSHFLSKRALEVSTRQILDLILPEFSVVKELSKVGGGDEGAEALGKNLNPFKRKRDKPVVYWSGIIDASPKQRSVKYAVPDYFNGTLRVMAVAVAPAAIGVSQKKSFIRGPFVINPNAPLFVGPEDAFVASVAVANNVEGSGDAAKVELQLETSDNLEVVGETKTVLTIAEGRESTHRFEVKAKHGLGNADLIFTASDGKNSSRFRATLSVRPPTPYMTALKSGIIKDDDTEVPVTRTMYPQFRKLEVTVSPLPLGLARGLLSFLDRFPYGCTEQLVSRTVPALVLTDHPIYGQKRSKAREHIKHTFRVLQGRQNGQGAFGFWAANSHVSDFQATYAMHFLTEAKERKWPVPSGVHLKGLKYLRQLARNDLDSLTAARTRAYALYVLTRNGELAAERVSELRQYLDTNHKATWTKDLTLVYLAAVYDLMRDSKQANKLIRRAEVAAEVKADYDNFYDSQSYLAQFLYIVSKHFPERLEDVEGKLIEGLVEGIQKNHYNTLSSAYTVYGLEAYAAALQGGGAHNNVLKDLTIKEKHSEKKLVPLKIGDGLFPVMSFAPETQGIVIESKADFTIYYQVTAGGFDLKPPSTVLKDRLEVFREYVNAAGDVVNEASLGDELEVHLKLRSVNSGSLSNVAIVDLLPGGFDVVLGRGEQSGVVGRIATGSSTWSPQYADVREDRVVLYGTVNSDVRQLVYKIKATTRGEFTVPPTFGESMYDRTIQGRSLGGHISVSGID